VVDGMKVELNDAMVDQRARQMVEDIGQRIQQQGISLDTYLGWMGTNLADFTKSQRVNAEKTIRQELALSKIAELEGITVTDEDRDAELKNFAEQYGMEVDTIKTFMDMERMDESILYKKAADLIIENAVALPEPEPEKVEPAEAEKAAEAETAENKAE
jgi:trigger factor